MKAHAGRPKLGCSLADESMMGAVPLHQSQNQASMTFRRRLLNVLGLSTGWCLMVSVMFIQLSTTTLAARDYNGSATATLPAGIMMATATLSMTPGSLLMKRFGRKPVLLLSGLAGVGGGVLLILAARLRLLWLLIVGSIPLGVCFAQSNNLRFAATDFAPPGLEPKALSLVVTGAVLSAVVGPEVGRHTLHALDPPYTATYCFVTGLCLLYTLLIVLVEFQALQSLAAEKASAAAAVAAVSDGGRPDGGEVVTNEPARSNSSSDLSPASTNAGSAQNRKRWSASSIPRDDGDGDGGGGDNNVGRDKTTTTPPVSSSEPEGTMRSAGVSIAPDAVHLKPNTGMTEGTIIIIKNGSDEEGAQEGRGLPPKLQQKSETSALEDLALPSCPHLPTAVQKPIGSSSSSSTGDPGRTRESLPSMFLSWEYMVPVLTASLSYSGMAGMMTASPLAIRDASYSFEETTQVIQVHIISMFLPSLVTGDIIGLISARWTMTLGSLLQLCGTAIFFSAKQLGIFFAGNSVVGLGWNWAYVGASALVTGTYTPETKFVAQGVMDTAVLFGTGLSVVLAGTLYSRLGWAVYTAIFVVCSGAMVIMDVVLLIVLYRRGQQCKGKGT